MPKAKSKTEFLKYKLIKEKVEPSPESNKKKRKRYDPQKILKNVELLKKETERINEIVRQSNRTASVRELRNRVKGIEGDVEVQPEQRMRTPEIDLAVKKKKVRETRANVSKKRKTTAEERRKIRASYFCHSRSDRHFKRLTYHFSSSTLIMSQIRQSVLTEDWDNVTKLLLLLLNSDPPNQFYYNSYIVKVAFMIFLHNPAARHLLDTFLQSCLSCQTEEEMDHKVRLFKKIKRAEADDTSTLVKTDSTR